MVNVVLGIIQLIIAGLLVHRVMPITYDTSKLCSLRVWFFSLALACYGMEMCLNGLGYHSPDGLETVRHISMVLAGVIWLGKIYKSGGVNWTNSRVRGIEL